MSRQCLQRSDVFYLTLQRFTVSTYIGDGLQSEDFQTFLMKYHLFGYFLATKGQIGYVSLINFQFGQLVTDMLIFGKKIIRSVGLKKNTGFYH